MAASEQEPTKAHVASETLAARLREWVAAESDYARAYAETRGRGGLGTRIECLRAEVAYYDAGEALRRAVEWDGLLTVPDPPRPPREEDDEEG